MLTARTTTRPILMPQKTHLTLRSWLPAHSSTWRGSTDADITRQYKRQKKHKHSKKRGYGWEHDRYSKDYGCGKDDDDDDASPHAIILVRGTLSLFEWQLGKVTCSHYTSDVCNHCRTKCVAPRTCPGCAFNGCLRQHRAWCCNMISIARLLAWQHNCQVQQQTSSHYDDQLQHPAADFVLA